MNLQSLKNYVHVPLQDSEQEIRLIEVLPGNFGDDLHLKLHYAPLVGPPAQNQGTRLELAEIESTLPLGWKALKDLEDRLIFQSEDGSHITRTHPNPSVAWSLHDSTPRS